MLWESLCRDDRIHIHEQVRNAARQAVRKAGLRPCDAEDLEQDLWADLLTRWPRYDPQRSSIRTYVDRVLRHRVHRILEHRSAQCRDPRKVAGSVEQFEEAAEDGLHVRDLNDYLRSTRQDEEETLSLRVDLERALQGMCPEIRELCHQRVQGSSVREMAKEAGISTSTAHRVFATARDQLQELGLDEYLR